MKTKFCIFLFLLCSIAWSESIGHAIISRSYEDSAKYINFVDTSMTFNTSGKIYSWSIYGTRTGPLFLQVYRKVSGNIYSLVGENAVTTNGTGSQSFSIDYANQIQFQAGDFLGWRFTVTTSHPTVGGVISWGYPGSQESGGVRWVYSAQGITDGEALDFSSADNRTYSIQANFSNTVPEPSGIFIFLVAFVFLYKRCQ